MGYEMEPSNSRMGCSLATISRKVLHRMLASKIMSSSFFFRVFPSAMIPLNPMKKSYTLPNESLLSGFAAATASSLALRTASTPTFLTVSYSSRF